MMAFDLGLTTITVWSVRILAGGFASQHLPTPLTGRCSPHFCFTQSAQSVFAKCEVMERAGVRWLDAHFAKDDTHRLSEMPRCRKAERAANIEA